MISIYSQDSDQNILARFDGDYINTAMEMFQRFKRYDSLIFGQPPNMTSQVEGTQRIQIENNNCIISSLCVSRQIQIILCNCFYVKIGIFVLVRQHNMENKMEKRIM